LNNLIYLKCSGKPFRRKGKKDGEGEKLLESAVTHFHFPLSPYRFPCFDLHRLSGLSKKYERLKKVQQALVLTQNLG
jgi:hypothetical protein